MSGRTALAALLCLVLSADASAAAPETAYWDGRHLAGIKHQQSRHAPAIEQALKCVKRDADAALGRGPYSVVDKSIVPPSGDKHDYLSFSRYWWPNPDTPDGLPYVRRDGVVNRELLRKGDRLRLGAFCDDVESLSLAAYLIDQKRYAPHATRLLKTWFIDPATRMNPNLRYGQGVPGKADGRGVGILDTRHFIRVLDAVKLLEAIDALGASEVESLKRWFDDYLTWLLTSELGQEEMARKNNHGTWFFAQAARIALFVDKPSVTERLLRDVTDRRLEESIRPDGSQPEELSRTRSLHYSVFNLSALAVLAELGEHVGVDVWRATDEDRGRLRRGIDFVTPYLAAPKRWEHTQLGVYRPADRERHVFQIASDRYDSETYAEAIREAPLRDEDRFYRALLFP